MHCPGFRSRSALDLRGTRDRYVWRTAQIATEEELRKKKSLVLDLDATLQALQDFRSTAAPAGPRNEKWLVTFNNQHATMQIFWEHFSAVMRSGCEQANFTAKDTEVSMQAPFVQQGPSIARPTERQARECSS